MPEANLNGRELYYEVEGEGPSVVLVHSAIADHTLWDRQVEALKDRFRVLRYDVAGHGRSPLPPGPFSHLDDLAALLGLAGVAEPAALVGNSSGARIALEYTLAHPEAVEALALVGAGLPDHDWSDEMQRADEEEERLFEAGDFEGAADAQVRFWVDGPRRRPDAVDAGLRERARRMILRSYELYREAEAAGEPKAQWLDPPASGRLGEVGVPTLVVVGDEDASDLFPNADRLEAEIPGARQAIVPGAAHLLPLEKPDELNRLLLDFLGR